MVNVRVASSIRYSTRYVARRADQTPSTGARNGLPTCRGLSRNGPRIRSKAAAATASGSSLPIARFAGPDHTTRYGSLTRVTTVEP